MGFDKDLLDDVIDLALTPGVASGGGKDPGLIFFYQRFEGGFIAGQNRANPKRVGPERDGFESRRLGSNRTRAKDFQHRGSASLCAVIEMAGEVFDLNEGYRD